jgi:hypothetical protein
MLAKLLEVRVQGVTPPPHIVSHLSRLLFLVDSSIVARIVATPYCT